mmetsp:Transcript_63900/g.103309  ORF Transcript_63900/g.103309 Transcript_63900/m.103309 type:complete len:391 (-) Transcript_63900:190-1362(-)
MMKRKSNRNAVVPNDASTSRTRHGTNHRRMLDNSIMTEADNESLRKKMQSLRNGTMNAWTTSPELTAMLCLPPDEHSHGRFVEYMQNIQLLSALLLSATLGVALNPLDVNAMPQSEQGLGDAYNFLASLLAVINVVCSVFGSYILMQALSVSQTDMVRILTRSEPIVVYEWCTFISMLIILALVCLSTYMKSSPHMALPTVYAVCGFFVLMIVQGMWTMQRIFPVSGGSWARTIKCELPWNNRAAKRSGAFMLGVAEGHLGRDLVEPALCTEHEESTVGGEQAASSTANDQVSVEEAADTLKAQEQISSLRNFMEDALKHNNPSRQRLDLLVAALLEEDLFLSVLSDAAQGDNGEKLVFEALDLDGDVRILRGERLALAKALFRNANGSA